MCGRFTLQGPADAIRDLFDLDEELDLRPRYNIAPTQEILVARAPEGEIELALLRWGLVPFFMKDASRAARMINARSETAPEKPSFRAAFRARRCLVPADGFYEWKSEGGRKQPYHVSREDGRPFAMAGLWERWTSPEGGVVETAAILTTAPNETVAPLHDRMPAILAREDFGPWLDPGLKDLDLLRSLLGPWEGAALKIRAVDPRVNSPRHDDPGCLADAE